MADGDQKEYGFGGAPILALEQLLRLDAVGAVAFFGVEVELARAFGKRDFAAVHFLRRESARMAPWTQTRGSKCYDIGSIIGDPSDALDSVVMLGSFLQSRGCRPVAVGLDHTVSYAHALALSSRDVIYVYFDAHFDLGLHHYPTTINNGNFVGSLLSSGRFSSIINVGARCWTTYDPAYHDVRGFRTIRFNTPSQTLDELAILRERTIYVSMDSDILDPAFVPNVANPEPFGLMPLDLLSICSWLGENCTVVGADLSELLSCESGSSPAIFMRCIHALFDKQARRTWT